MNLKEELLKLQDEKYRKFNENICKDTRYKLLGIRMPILRTLAKEISKEENFEEYLDLKNIEYFEEVLIKGLIIAYKKLSFEEKKKYIKEYVPHMDSWAMTDTFCPTLKIKEKDLSNVWNFILPYTQAKGEFEVRFAVIMMLDYYITDEYVDKVIYELNKITHEGYYVKMGVAWCLAEIGIKYNEKLMKFLKGKNNLDNFTYNKTLQKMIESYRISDDDKNILRKMKRK